jgi:hypothetical protein
MSGWPDSSNPASVASSMQCGKPTKIHARMAQRTNRADACWFSLMVARKQERVADSRFCRNMDLYL